MKYRKVPAYHCEKMPEVGSYGSVIGLHSAKEEGPVTHIHIYNLDRARKEVKSGRIVLASTIQTVSCDQYFIVIKKEKMRVLQDDGTEDEFSRVPDSPAFETPQEAWNWISNNHPEHHP